MANLVELDQFDAGIYQLETTDPVMGGAGGVSNLQAQSLANRTNWLKGKLDTMVIAPTTPAQFDNDTSLATTAFVQRALGNFVGASGTGGATILTTADVGAFRFFSGSSAYNVTLPLVAGLPNGAMIGIGCNNSSSITILRQGADVISPLAGSDLTSFSIGYGENVFFVKEGSRWVVAFGTASNFISNGFAASRASPGYQKLPSGIIVQWGGTTGSASADVSVTYPIAFPTQTLNFQATASAVGAGYIACLSSASTTGAQVGTYSAATTRVSSSFYWLALGC